MTINTTEDSYMRAAKHADAHARSVEELDRRTHQQSERRPPHRRSRILPLSG